MEESPRPEVRVLLDSGALRDSLGCGGEGEVEPTRLWYLLGARATTRGVWEVGAAEEKPIAALP